MILTKMRRFITLKNISEGKIRQQMAEASIKPDPPKLPEGTPEYMAGAYYGCLIWAIGTPAILAEFEKETGVKIPSAPRSALDQMIDEAAGVYADFVTKFKEWHDVNVWGDMREPVEKTLLALAESVVK